MCGSNAAPPLSLTLVDRGGKHIDIEVRRSDGYVNATKLCQAVGKFWNHYTSNSKTKEFLSELSDVEKIPVENLLTGNPVSTIPSVGLIESGKNQHRNTWIHPDVSINLAQWASAKYGVAVSRLIRRYQTGQVTTADSLAASRTLASQISFVDCVELEKQRIDAHAKLELEKYKYQADVDANLALQKHISTCDAGNEKYFRTLAHEKEMMELKAEAETRVLDRERELCERFGYPMSHLTIAKWWAEYVMPCEESDIRLDDAIGHYRTRSGHDTTLKKQLQAELKPLGVRTTNVFRGNRIFPGFRGFRFKSLSERDDDGTY